MVLLKSCKRRRCQSAPGSASTRSYTHDTSIRKAGTTKPMARVHRHTNIPAPSESSLTDACEVIDCGDFVEEAEGGTEGTSINNFLGLDVHVD